MQMTPRTAKRAHSIATGVHGCRPLISGRRLLTIVALLLILAACGGSAITQTSRTEHYTVQLTLDGTGFGERTANVEIHDLAGQPVTVDQLVLAPVMRDMGMAAPEITAQPLAPGRYQANGQLFVMTGVWELDVRVSAGGTEEVTSFKFEVTQQ